MILNHATDSKFQKSHIISGFKSKILIQFLEFI